VVCLKPDGAAAPGGQVVRLYHDAFENRSGPRLAATTRSDSLGIARFEVDRAGSFIVSAGDSEPEDPSPLTARAVVVEHAHLRERVCAVVCGLRTRSVTIRVQTGPGPGIDRDPRVILTQRDGGTGQHFPIPVQLQAGVVEAKVRLPVGIYEARVLPLGVLEVAPDTRLLRIESGDDPAHLIRLQATPIVSRIELEGIETGDLPVTVFPRAIDAVQDEDQDLLFCGPRRWKTKSESVHGLTGSFRFVVRGRNRYWVSAGEVQLPQPVARTTLLRACRLEIAWVAPRSVVGPAVIVTSGSGDATVLLRQKIFDCEGRPRLAWVGSLVVPFGPATVRAAVSGSQAWSRTVDVAGAHMQVVVEDQE
jgi:hypothetical protein